MFCEIDTNPQNIHDIQPECGGIFCRILSISRNIVMDLNNVMMGYMLFTI